MKKSNRYIVVVIRDSGLMLIRAFSTKFKPGTDEFIEAVDNKYHIGNSDDWKAFPVIRAREVKTFIHHLEDNIRQLNTAYGIWHDEEINENQIPLPIEGEK